MPRWDELSAESWTGQLSLTRLLLCKDPESQNDKQIQVAADRLPTLADQY